MVDPAAWFALAFAATLGLGLASFASLRAWREWLDLKRLELTRGAARRGSAGRSDLSELRDRVRRLEAIATGLEI